ncbi:SH3 domain-containing protein [Nitrincola tapanii]|uniref:SH3 domain-containing protein n=1 Tax=Nitrincola tapanii TaxID=1708751 RepID=A0A5A9W7X2_9GAMM|nr:SH3 domain-containing protein [Nitrincola tapanii]KAA0876285.1 SH3 domain-containing protein [Nitrincola tapanii]
MKPVSISVKSTQLRREPSFLSPIIRHLEYANLCDLQETRGDWALIRFSNLEGWVHQSALTSGQIVLSAGASDVQRLASNKEIALAGKGFNAEVEKRYRRMHRGTNYAAVDLMQRRSISIQALSHFIQSGDLNRV